MTSPAPHGTPHGPRILAERCVPRLKDRSGYPRYEYEAPPDENERLVDVALRLSRKPAVQDIVDRVGFDKDMTFDESDRFNGETVRVLDEIGWDAPFFYNILSSQALARRLCAGAIARDAAATCLRFVSERRCERYNVGEHIQRPKEPPARLSDYLTSLHYFQTRDDLWAPFLPFREREHNRIGNFISDEKQAKEVYLQLLIFALNEASKHALHAWRLPSFKGLVGAYAERRLDRFDDEGCIAEFLDWNSGDLVDDRAETRP